MPKRKMVFRESKTFKKRTKERINYKAKPRTKIVRLRGIYWAVISYVSDMRWINSASSLDWH